MNADNQNTVFNIPAGQPFARILAQELLKETQSSQERLSQYLILLPTRRACRVLREAFLSLKDHKPMLLPRMQPVGDLDEEELSLSILAKTGESGWYFPPAMPNLQRQILLAKLIQKLHGDIAQEQSLKLAQALGQLMDQIYTENLDMKDLATLVPDEFAKHWQITLEFLEILSSHWPKILAEHGMIDTADRRNRLILALAEYWQNHPPQTPVIGAGSTGSIPATGKLLSTITTLPQGRIILPGLDTKIDEDSWSTLSETHPQFGLKQLLSQIGVDHKTVTQFGDTPDALNTTRQILSREIMRPAETSNAWSTIKTCPESKSQIENALEDLSLLTCSHTREEGDAIALLMREVLETPNKTACLITPDRNLAVRVAAACKRWNITVDDSAGQSLKYANIGIFLGLITDTVSSQIAPVSLLAVLKHNACNILDDHTISALDYSLRGCTPAKGFDGLRNHIHAKDRLSEDIKSVAIKALEKIEPAFTPLLEMKDVKKSFSAYLQTHILCAENLNARDSLWSNDDGSKAATFFAELFDQTATLGALNFNDYAATLEHFMDQVQIRPAFGTHPRLQILGQLEARLIDADLVILGGLNEGIWPPDPAADPWMSRPMRKKFGLPSPERGIGLAAHDFIQGLCTPRVIMTRSMRQDGAPSVPSRWLQRLDAVLESAGCATLQPHDAIDWAQHIDTAEDFSPVSRPAPTPPAAARPNRLSVTQIETWLRDPYSIYARHVLDLTMIEPLEKPFDAAERGQLIHAVLEEFAIQTKTALPKNAEDTLLNIAHSEIEKRHEPESTWSFWHPRFAKTAKWIAEHETTWRENTEILSVETRGQTTLNIDNKPFTLVAIADRIDKTTDGRGVIIDYKSGGTYSKTAMKNGQLPQLPLEALILSEGGFPDIGAHETSSLQYWVLSGSAGGKITNLDQNIDDLVTQTRDNLKMLVEIYNNPQTPYLSLPRPDQAPRFNDYEHLARIKEWGLTSDEAEGEAA